MQNVKKNLLLLSLLFFLVVLSKFLFSLKGILSSTPIDFYHYYLASFAVLNNQNPYIFVPQHYFNNNMQIIFNYPPTALFFFWPLSIFPIEMARIIWFGLNFIILGIVIYFSLKIMKIHNTLNYILVFTLALLSFPIRHTFGMGQVSIILTLLIYLNFYFFKKKNKIFAGLFLAGAILLKIFPVIFLVFYLLNKEWRIILSSLVFIIIGIVTITIFLESSVWTDFYKIMPKPDLFLQRANYYEQSISAFISRLPILYSVKMVLFILFETFLFVIAVFKRFYKNTQNQFSLFIIFSVIGLGFNWQHYFALLILPYILILKKIRYDSYKKFKYTSFSLIIYIFSYLSISLNIKNPVFWIDNYQILGPLILSHGLGGVLLLVSLHLTPKICKS